MGKISDIWVRLGLKKEGFDKGMDDAGKKVEGFGGAFGKIKAGALAVWSAIGASVVAFGQQMIKTTNAIGDQWGRFTAQAKAGWDTFIQSLSSMNWDNFIGRFREATAAAKELQNTLDAEFEISNSIKLQKAAMEEELNALEILARNSSKPYEERAKAAQKYLDMVKPLYDQEMRLANQLLDAYQGKWLAGSGLADTKQTRDDLTKFLVDYGRDEQLSSSIGRMLALQKEYDAASSVRFRTGDFTSPNKVIDEYRALREYVQNFASANGYSTNIYELAKVYEKLRGDQDTEPLVEALIRAGKAAGAYDRDTKRMQMALNTALSAAGGAGGAGAESQTKLASITSAHEMAFKLGKEMENDIRLLNQEFEEIGDIELDLSDVDAEINAFLDDWRYGVEQVAMLNGMLEDSIVQSMGNGLQAITDMMMGLEGADMKNVLAAFIAPFGDTMKQMGAMIMAEGIAMEAFKESFENPETAIAAGAALMAIGSLVSSGLQRLTANPIGGGSSASYGGSSSYGSSPALNYENTLTIEVVGKISGSDIEISGKKTRDNWNR